MLIESESRGQNCSGEIVPTREKVMYREMARLALESVSGGQKKNGAETEQIREKIIHIEKWPGLLFSPCTGTREKIIRTYRKTTRLL